MNMQTCNSDKHPDYASIYDGDKHESCPACAMADTFGDMALVKLALEYMGEAYGTLQKLVQPFATNPAVGTEPEETLQPTPEPTPEPERAGPSTGDIKEECGRLEQQLGSAEMVQVRKQNVRFPSGGTIVTAWRGRRDTAIAYRDALQAAVADRYGYSAKMAEDNRAPEPEVQDTPPAAVQTEAPTAPTIDIPADVTDDEVPF